MPHCKVSELPNSIQSALKEVGYNKSDISISAKESISLMDSGSDGCRAFYVIIDLSGNNPPKMEYGSWGGANPFTVNRVDLDSNYYAIPNNIAIIQGSEGGNRPVMARITLSPSNMLPALKAAPSLSEEQRKALAAHRGLTSAGRKEFFSRNKDLAKLIPELIAKGYLKQNKAGAISITTEGLNACEGVNVW